MCPSDYQQDYGTFGSVPGRRPTAGVENSVTERALSTKKKEQKKKDREKRVAKKKHVAAQKKAQEKGAEGPTKFGAKPVDTIASLTQPKSSIPTSTAKKPFNYRRSGG